MNNTFKKIVAICIVIAFAGCKTPSVIQRTENKEVPTSFGSNGAVQDTINSGKIKWKDYFKDPKLVALIEMALANNQELNITMQEIEISRNEIRARKGEYLPFVGLKGSAGVDKFSRFTNIGAMEANTEIKPGKEMPEPLQDYSLGAYATWELDIWNKLHNAKKAAVSRYLSSVEGKNFMTTNLIAEIADFIMS